MSTTTNNNSTNNTTTPATPAVPVQPVQPVQPATPVAPAPTVEVPGAPVKLMKRSNAYSAPVEPATPDSPVLTERIGSRALFSPEPVSSRTLSTAPGATSFGRVLCSRVNTRDPASVTNSRVLSLPNQDDREDTPEKHVNPSRINSRALSNPQSTTLDAQELQEKLVTVGRTSSVPEAPASPTSPVKRATIGRTSSVPTSSGRIMSFAVEDEQTQAAAEEEEKSQAIPEYEEQSQAIPDSPVYHTSRIMSSTVEEEEEQSQAVPEYEEQSQAIPDSPVYHTSRTLSYDEPAAKRARQG